MAPLRVGLAAAWVVLLLATAGAAAETEPSREYRIKAAFLFNFAQFVDWPETAFADARAPLVIGVLGDDPFGAFLDETVRGERVNGRELLVRRYRRASEIDVCHVLFVSQSEARRWRQLFVSLKGRPILTVGDAEGFALDGGMIRFTTESNRIRLRICVEAAKAAGLSISSKLLRPSAIVAPGSD